MSYESIEEQEFLAGDYECYGDFSCGLDSAKNCNYATPCESEYNKEHGSR